MEFAPRGTFTPATTQCRWLWDDSDGPLSPAFCPHGGIFFCRYTVLPVCSFSEIGAELVARLLSQLAEKDATISKIVATISKKDATISEKNAAISEKDAMISEKNAAISEKDARLADNAVEIAALKLKLKKQGTTT